MALSTLQRRVLILAAVGVVLALVAILAMRWPRTLAPENAAGDDADRDRIEERAGDGIAALRIRLLADGGVSAQPASVRIGLASVSPDDEAAYRVWQRSGREGAGPGDYADLATVARWIDAPARLQADGSVMVGPMALPAAMRYVLQARADDGLRFYEASFMRENAPAELRPRVAAGLRVRAPLGVDGIGVLLRRVEGGQDAAWQRLLRREAAVLLDAYDERAIVFDAQDMAHQQGMRIAPLPPGPVDVIAVVRGVESERRRVVLVAGRDSVLDLNREAVELGDALATRLVLTLIDAETKAPVRDVLAVWPSSPRGEQCLRPSEDGAIRFDGIDASESLALELRFESKGTPSFIADDLPRWPERIPLRFDLSEDAGVGETLSGTSNITSSSTSNGTIEKRIELQPLRWLIVETPGIEIPRRPRMGDPFPVFVLQGMQGAAWGDLAADEFRPIDIGIAVSIDKPGRMRVATVLSPWALAFTDAVESRVDIARQFTRLRLGSGRDARLRIVADGRALAFAPVQILSPLRGVPSKTLNTDGNGRITLPAATVPAVRVEVPGFEQAEARLGNGETTVVLSRSNESAP
jgi:hypothetical protein